MTRAICETRMGIAILSMNCATPARTSRKRIIIVIMIVRGIFAIRGATSAFINTRPGVSYLILASNLCINIDRSTFALMCFMISIYRKKRTCRAFAHNRPRPLSTIFMRDVSNVKKRFNRSIRRLSTLRLEIVRTRTSSRRSCPCLIFKVLRRATNRVILRVMIYLSYLTIAVCGVSTFTNSSPGISLLIFVGKACIDT